MKSAKCVSMQTLLISKKTTNISLKIDNSGGQPHTRTCPDTLFNIIDLKYIQIAYFNAFHP